MKKVIVTFLLLSTSLVSANPNFTIGSNPFFTTFAFPHDLLKWPKKAVFSYYNPQTSPWQGNITDLDLRPTDAYISNYSDFDFPNPEGYSGERSYLKSSGYYYNNRYSFGGVWDFDEYGKTYLEFGINRLSMELKAEGVVRDDDTFELIPVQAYTYAKRRYYDVQFMYANYLFGNPFGLKVQYQDKNMDSPDSQIKYMRNGTEVISKRLTWGWTTTPCAHIFRNPNETAFHQNFDAWFLNDYTLYQGGQLDLQLSYEIGNFKSGIRYRRNSELGKYYSWQGNGIDTLTAAGVNFDGSYITDNQHEYEIANDLIRAYSKVRFWQFGDLDVGLLFFLQYANRDKNWVSSNRTAESDPLTTDAENEYTIELNPWLNYKFGKSYFDFGLLFEFSYTGLKNTESTRWNSAIGANQKDVIRDSYPYENDFSPSWETFSQGNNTFFATGFEANTSINISGRFSALGSLLILRKYSFITKEYGQSEIPAGGTQFVFQKSHTRDDYKNETWMTGFIGISYGLGPIQTIITMQFPLAYLLIKQTELSDSQTTLVDKTQRNVWAVQQPIGFRMLLVFGLER